MTTWYDPQEIKDEADGAQRQPEFAPEVAKREWDPNAEPYRDWETDTTGQEGYERVAALVAGVNRIKAIIDAQITNRPEATQ